MLHLCILPRSWLLFIAAVFYVVCVCRSDRMRKIKCLWLGEAHNCVIMLLYHYIVVREMCSSCTACFFLFQYIPNTGSVIEPQELMLCIKLLRDLFTLVTNVIFPVKIPYENSTPLQVTFSWPYYGVIFVQKEICKL